VKPPGLAGALQGTPVDDPAKAAAVLAEARKALGGEDKLKAVQRLEMKGKSTRAAGNTNIEGDFEVLMELPDKFRRKEGLAISSDRGFMIDILQVLNGALAMQKIEAMEGGQNISNFEEGNRGNRGNNSSNNRSGNRGRGFNVSGLLGGVSTENMDPREREEYEHAAISSELARFTLVLLATANAPITWIGTAKTTSTTADVLEFKTPDGAVTHLFIEDKKHLPLMLAWTGIPSQLGNRGRGNQPQQQQRGGGNRGSNNANWNANNRPAPLQMYFSDYKGVGGIKLPHLVQSGSNDETNEEIVVKSYRINPVFKADAFSVE
jgi:hypothetical protein